MKKTLVNLYPFLSILAQFLVGLFLGLAALPSLLWLRWVWARLGGLESFWAVLAFGLALGLAFVLFGNSLLLLIALVRNLFRLGNRERRDELISWASVKTALYNLLLHIAGTFYLPMLKSGYFNVLFYRAMGTQIGKGTLIATHRIWDCDLVEIGEDCVIGGNSSISAHYAVGNRARLRKVRIGNRVTLGANSSVMPGVVIEDDVLVGANSLVPMGMRLKAGGVYLGVPAKKVN
ncbi:MAG: hypothetical protein KIS85_05040 [Anaerolineales bacterium]|nr:hypothetical protein [Anaerolineales bacterium]